MPEEYNAPVEDEGFAGQEDEVSYSPQTVDPSQPIWLEDPEDVIENLKHSLRRENYDINTKTWVRPEVIKPMIIEQGVYDIESIIRSFLNKVAFLSDINEKTKNNMLRSLGRNIGHLIFNKADDYKIDETDFDTIALMVLNNGEFALTHPLNASDKRFLRGTERRTVNIRDAGKKSAAGKILGFFG